MTKILNIFILLLLLGSTGELLAQKKKFKMNPAFAGRYKNISVPKSKMNSLCPGYEGNDYPFQGIGVKLGDPFAVTYKAFLSKSISIVMDVGRVSSGLYNDFHLDNFQNELRPDTLTGSAAIKYFGHSATKNGIFAAKLIYSYEISKVNALRAYLGVGVQYRWSTIEYAFIREVPNDNNELGRFIFENTTSGAAGTLGIEYSHPSLPISSFFEFESYFDMARFPGWIRLSGGVGLRYLF